MLQWMEGAGTIVETLRVYTFQNQSLSIRRHEYEDILRGLLDEYYISVFVIRWHVLLFFSHV